MFWIPPWHILITSLMLLHTRTDVQLLLHPPPCAFFPCLAYTSITTVTHSCIYSSCTLWNAHTPTHTNAPTCANLKIHPERLLCGIQSRCNLKASPLPQMWHQLVLSLARPPPSPYSLPLSYPLSSAEPIFWHFRRCSSHACHLSPPPPTLSSQLSIESMRLCLKLMYFVELTLWRLHHLEVGKWYWAERPIFSV